MNGLYFAVYLCDKKDFYHEYDETFFLFDLFNPVFFDGYFKLHEVARYPPG